MSNCRNRMKPAAGAPAAAGRAETSERVYYTLMMPDDRTLWIRQSFQLALATAAIHFLQCVSGIALWMRTDSVALAAFAVDALVSAFAALVLALRIHRSFGTLGENWRSRPAAYGY